MSCNKDKSQMYYTHCAFEAFFWLSKVAIMLGGGVPYRTRCLICVKLRVSYETWSHIRTRSLNGILIKPNPWVSYETTLYFVNFELVMILTHRVCLDLINGSYI